MSILGTLAVRLSAQTADLKKGLRDAESRIQDFSQKASSVAKGASIAFAGMSGGLALATRAAETQIQAELKLASAIKGSGQAIDADKIKRYASELQNLTTFGDEATIESAAMLQTFRLTEDQLMTLIPQVQNLSAFMGTDLKTSALTLGKALDGQAGMLARYGITMAEADKAAFQMASRQERVAILAKTIQSNVGDAAQTLAQTAGGAFKQMTNAAGDLVEQFGFVLQQPLGDFFRGVTERISSLAEWFASLNPEVRKWVGIAALAVTGATGLAAGVAAVAAVLPAVISGFGVLGGVITGAFLPVIGTIAAVAAAIGGVILIVGSLRMAWNENLGGMRDAITSWINGVKRVWSDMIDTIKGWWDKFASTISDTAIDLFAFVTRMSPEEAFELKQSIKGKGGIGEMIAGSAKDTFGAIKDAGAAAVDGIASSWDKGMSAIKDAAKGLLPSSSSASASGGGSGSFPGIRSGGGKREASASDLATRSGFMSGVSQAVQEYTATLEAETEIARQQAQQHQAMVDHLASTGMTFLSSLGDFGSAISNAVNAFQQGGPLAALASVGLDLLMKTEAFAKIQSALTDSFGFLVAASEPLLEGVFSLLEPLFGLIGLISGALAPGFKVIGKVIENLTFVLDGVAWVIEKVLRGIAWVWNGILNIIIGAMRAIDKIPLADLRDDIRALEDMKMTFDDTTKAADSAGEAMNEAFPVDLPDNFDDLNDTVKKVNGSLTNTPQGFKVALARFRATSGDAMLPLGSGAANSQQVVFNIRANDADGVYRVIKEQMRRDGFLSNGTTVPLGGAYSAQKPSGGG